MKTIKITLKAVAAIGVFTAMILSDSLYPSIKELMSSVVILAMSVTMLIVAKKIDELSTENKK